jgi:glucose-6-phosphate isomerase
MENLRTRLVSDRAASRLWAHDASLVSGPSPDPEVARSVATRLGWLQAPEAMAGQIDHLHTFARNVRQNGLTDVFLLGMGGSSLCAEVLRDVPLRRVNPCRLTVLDTTDERAIADATSALDPASALFLVASKSGTTIEVVSLERHFRGIMSNALGPSIGRHFVAITDPSTPLVAHAARHGYRETFVNPADIGGRYSALSLFGLVPSALLGLDLATLLGAGRSMAGACRADDPDNPGIALGAFMAGHAAAGRDKLTLLVSGPLAPLGVWIEQLVAESTGKRGHGVLPVVGEPIQAPARYGNDRQFVALITPDAPDVADAAHQLEAAGHPVFRIETDASALGAEFFRWEFATAIAGVGLGVNPFDEPNVKEAKARTQSQLDGYARSGTLAVTPPLEERSGYRFREHRPAPEAESHGARGRYLAFLDYLPAGEGRAAVDAVRRDVLSRSGLATTHGVGPRYLHSTGQYHKGGPNTGVFVLITAPDQTATIVPDAGYTFSVLKRAQALGDFEALSAAGRHVVHVDVDDPARDLAGALQAAVRGLA